MTNIVSSLVNGIVLNPIEAAGVLVAWIVMVGLALMVRRLRSRPSWRFEWLVWTYVCTSIVLSVALDGARLAEHFTPNPTVLAMIWSFGTSLFYALLAAVIWPLFWASSLFSAIGSPGTLLYLLAVVVFSVFIGAMIAYVIAVATRGLPGGGLGPARPAS